MSHFLWILDNGHGENTPGKRSPVWNDGTQLMEWEFNRNVVKYMSYMLKQADIDYHILVPELIDVSLKVRCNRANELAEDRKCVYISVHSNAFISGGIHGFETHYYSVEGMKFARNFQDQIKVLGNDRDIKESGFYVLKYTSMPAILTENGFYTNQKECRKLMTPEFQLQIAEAHVKAIKITEYTNDELF